MRHAEADDARGQGVPCLLDDLEAVVADPHPAKALEPGDGAFDDPADLAQTAAVGRPPLGDERLDAQPAEQPAGVVAVVSAVGVQLVGRLLGAAWLAPDPGE